MPPSMILPHNILDLFNNPVGYRTSLGKMRSILLFLSGCCSETEVSEQLYCTSHSSIHIFNIRIFKKSPVCELELQARPESAPPRQEAAFLSTWWHGPGSNRSPVCESELQARKHPDMASATFTVTCHRSIS
jgi:hypothetical protein